MGLRLSYFTQIPFLLILLTSGARALTSPEDCGLRSTELESGYSCNRKVDFGVIRASHAPVQKVFEKMLLPAFNRDLYLKNLESAAVRYIYYRSQEIPLHGNYASDLSSMCPSCSKSVIDELNSSLQVYKESFDHLPVVTSASVANSLNKDISSLNADLSKLNPTASRRTCLGGLYHRDLAELKVRSK